jgi:hypothetical protein
MPWKLLHDGYQTSRQSTVVRVTPDAGVPISHSRFSTAGRILAVKIYVNTEPEWWVWYNKATRNGAVPFWVYDAKVNGFMRCRFTDEPTCNPAGNMADGVNISLPLFAEALAMKMINFITESDVPNLVTEEADTFLYTEEEVAY